MIGYDVCLLSCGWILSNILSFRGRYGLPRLATGDGRPAGVQILGRKFATAGHPWGNGQHCMYWHAWCRYENGAASEQAGVIFFGLDRQSQPLNGRVIRVDIDQQLIGQIHASGRFIALTHLCICKYIICHARHSWHASLNEEAGYQEHITYKWYNQTCSSKPAAAYQRVWL